VLANDTGDGGTLCVTDYDATGLRGSLGALNIDGSFTFTPEPNFNGVTTFTYGLGEFPPLGECPQTADVRGVVTITVAPVNDPPTATADSFIVLAGRTLNVGEPGVLINDSDIDGDTITAVKVKSPTHGVLNLEADGSFSYTPTAGFTGNDGFSYRASDGSPDMSPERAVSLHVTPIPPSPTPKPSPTPVPTPVPTPTPVPATPTPEPSLEPSPSPSPSASLEPSTAPSASPAPSPSIVVLPSPTAQPGPASDEDGVSTPVLIVVVLFAILLAFGAAVYVPKLLRGPGTDADDDDVS
jgi:hypothetical protein